MTFLGVQFAITLITIGLIAFVAIQALDIDVGEILDFNKSNKLK